MAATRKITKNSSIAELVNFDGHLIDLIDPNDPGKGNIYNYRAVHGEYELYAWGENRKKLAPIGWRLPTIGDYAELLCFLMQNDFAINISGNNENCDEVFL